MKDMMKINDILLSIKPIKNYQNRAKLNLTIDDLLYSFLPRNLKQEIRAFSLKDGTLTLLLNSSITKANFLFIENKTLIYLQDSLPNLKISKIETKIYRTTSYS